MLMLDKPKKFLKIIQLKNKQRVVEKQFEAEGLTDEVFEKQLEINRERHEHDISDSSKKVFEDYVQ